MGAPRGNAQLELPAQRPGGSNPGHEGNELTQNWALGIHRVGMSNSGFQLNAPVGPTQQYGRTSGTKVESTGAPRGRAQTELLAQCPGGPASATRGPR